MVSLKWFVVFQTLVAKQPEQQIVGEGDTQRLMLGICSSK